MSSKKISSVEWLFTKLWKTPKDKFEWHALLEQAKAMHKEEVKKHFNDGYDNGWDNWGDGSGKTGEQYYNETFPPHNSVD